MDLLERLLEHDRWASAHLLKVSRDLTDAQLDREFEIGHRTLRATFDHLSFIIEFWLAVATGQSIDDIERDSRSVAVLSARHDRSYDRFAAFARRIRDEGRLDDTFVAHFGERMTFGGMILHVILHNAEHRTEAVHILQRLGAPGVPAEIEVDHALWDLSERAG